MALACPTTCATRCSSRWYPVAPTAPGWGWRCHARSRSNTAATFVTPVVKARPSFPSTSRWSVRMTEIWIADDDRGVRFVLAEALRDAGHSVREFSAGDAVRAALNESRPALLVTDVRMPG